MSFKEKWTFQFDDGMLFSRSAILAIFIPVVLETLLSYLIGLMDSMMVSSAGEAAVSAVSMVDSINVLFINIFSSLATGGAVVCGQFLGRRNTEKAREASGQIIMLLFLISLALTAVLRVCRNPILNFLYGTAEASVLENCSIYYSIVVFSIPFIALYNGGSAVFRMSGDSSTPLKISVGMNIINVVGNAVLIFVFKMGVAGVAIPTLVSRGIGMVIILLLALRENFTLNIRSIKNFRFDRVIVGNVLSIGVPSGIESGMFQFGKLILMTLVSTLSTASITANAIGNTLGSLHVFVGMAANNAVMAVISRCAGAGRYDQARWYMRYLVKMTLIIQGIVNVVMIVLIPLTLRLYNVSPETARLAVPILLIHGITTIIMWPFAFMLNVGIRAAGDSKYAMWIASISMWLCRVGGAFLFVRVFNTDVVGVWIAWVIDWLFRISFFVPRYLGSKWETMAIKD